MIKNYLGEGYFDFGFFGGNTEYTEGMRSVCSAGTPQQVLLEKSFPWFFRINCVLLSSVVGYVHKNHHSTVHFRKVKTRGGIYSGLR